MILTIVTVSALAAGTIAYRSWKQRLQELPHEAEINRVEGIAALEAGNFDEAKNKLRRAANAYKNLRSSDEEALKAIQFADEAAILADLDLSDAKTIIEKAARLGEPDGPTDFATLHKGQSVVIDSTIESEWSPVGNKAPELSVRIFTGRGPAPARTGQYDLEGLKLFEGQNLKPGQRLIFGARYRSIRLEDGVWKIDLEPDSGVTMTNFKALQAANLVEEGAP